MYFVNFECNASRINKHDSLTIEKKIRTLLAKMTIEEKTGQMNAIFINSLLNWSKPDEITDIEKIRKYVIEKNVGAVIGADRPFSPDEWAKIISQLQEATKQTKHQIPVVYGVDAIRGFTYCKGTEMFPFNLAVAATRRPEYAREISRITNSDLSSVGIRWNFSPVLDLGMQPLWPRLIETYGEDPYLTTVFGLETVKEMELSNRPIASCLKHFYGYSNPASGKDRTPAYIPELMLREYFLPSFKAAIEAGASSIMVNSGELNGVPVHASKSVLTDLLRNELKFSGIVISDMGDIEKLYKFHRVAPDLKEAARLAVEAGIDMVMGTEKFSGLVAELVREGKVSEKRIDESVVRILRLKYRLGLFDEVKQLPEAYEKLDTELALQVTRESITLLKNEQNVLPLPENSRVLITGPGANCLTSLIGSWSFSWQGDKHEFIPAGVNSVFSYMEDKFGKESVKYVQGCSFEGQVELEPAIARAQEADYILLCLGENSYAEATGNTKDLSLCKNQIELTKAMAKTGKPIILVLTSGRPVIIREIEPLVKSIIYAYWPGPNGAEAISDVVFGKINPSGKLPFTYPKFPNDLKPYYHKYSEVYQEHFIPRFSENEKGFDPQYPFGFGLSYTTFLYNDLRLDKTLLHDNDTLTVSVNITNTGNREGEETVELYIRDLFASVTPPMKRLRRFTKIHLAAGETKTVNFTIDKADLMFVGKNLQLIAEHGDFQVLISDKVGVFSFQ